MTLGIIHKCSKKLLHSVVTVLGTLLYEKQDSGAKSADTLLYLPCHHQRVAQPLRMDEYKLTVCHS